MISTASSNASCRNSRSPFTVTQWQELEHQALIFKYMVSGVPVPPDLIYTVKRSLDTTSFSSRLFSHHPGGWGCFEMGFGRKVDPEPGRCRRTDGKKWRCSKEAYPDSKYCERHMHRGRNRSRKHVEVSSSSSSAQQPNTTATVTALTPATQQQTYSVISDHHTQTQASLYPYAYPADTSSSSRPTEYASLSSQTANSSSPYFCLKSEPYTTDKDYRYFQGTKESGMDELAFFPEAASTCHPLMGGYQAYPGGIIGEALKQSSGGGEDQDNQHCFILGTDFKSSKGVKDNQSETQKPLHHFFSDWPPKNSNNAAADSWLDLASNSRVPNEG